MTIKMKLGTVFPEMLSVYSWECWLCLTWNW